MGVESFINHKNVKSLNKFYRSTRKHYRKYRNKALMGRQKRMVCYNYF